ncbi:MAG: carbohydrate ABC transporter permease [Arthrobacter sp.]|uniref:carbohydrate ABC transporter permease n=1 Tax=Arthrobacter sp. 179 TaxID=3457734 RepID=UPI00264C9270|nr:carbohydrate ABC transporter permease [Micrococcaceae bacterium]MDN5811984.1 carbohydrate ABC transporter permease [Micrococcaceae bacterium]MDN5823095.1 carbohydrate ABC transporter permease [Micrococcaceae bacterium]MDN5879055.1 carbohydrate ABC transporter permease [Micrococcaceae bacterium]MDN5886400.1 carbohydrate ABC transporter permease [Micrococcaceae bacterium]
MSAATTTPDESHPDRTGTSSATVVTQEEPPRGRHGTGRRSSTSAPSAAPGRKNKAPLRPGRVILHVGLIVWAVLWLAPLAWAVYTSLRPYSETAEKGYVSLPDTLNFNNYVTAWTQADLPHYFLNSLYIAVPAVIIVLFMSSMAAFVLARFSFKLNLFMLMFFTAANLLPQQVIITPLYRMFLSLDIYNTQFGVVLINVAFQMGFCVFVLSNFMKALPDELGEAAQVDGAGVWRQFYQIVLPLTRPALAALATLEFAWIYNDFFWALVLLRDGDAMPVTSALNNLKGAFFTDNNLVAAGAVMIALPTVILFMILQKHFVAGLTLGSSK